MTASLEIQILALLALGAAVGVDLYAALIGAGILAYLGYAAVPPGLAGIAAPAVWVTLGGLLVVQALAARHRLADLAWNVLHTGVRPLGAALVIGAGLGTAPGRLQWAGALAGLLIGLWLHGAVLGLRTAARTAMEWNPARLLVLQVVTGATIGGLAFVRPLEAAALSGLLLILPLPWYPCLWRAGGLAIRALLAGIRLQTRPRNWEIGTAGWPKTRVQALAVRLGEPPETVRSTPATLARLEGRPLYRPGRLVRTDQGVLFLHGWLRAGTLDLQAASGSTDGASFLETLRLQGPRACALCVTRDGLPGPVILAGLGRGHAGMEHLAARSV